jgi:ribose-phosphate pyrophosphokinase
MILNLFNKEKSDLQYSLKEFSDGQPNIKFDPATFVDLAVHLKAHAIDSVVIHAKIKSSLDFMNLIFAVFTLRQLDSNLKIDLVMPYVWAARMDRIMDRKVKNEPFALNIVATLLNVLNLNKVIVLDPHSDVTPALIRNIEIVPQGIIFEQFLSMYNTRADKSTAQLTVISPDAGAIKKCYDTASDAGFDGIIINATKHRSVVDGSITATTIPVNDLLGADCVILDDICDGGRTFVELAKVLQKRNAGKLYLIVSHGIFSNGFETLLEYFEQIWTTNSFLDEKALTPEISPRVIMLNAFTPIL